MKFSEFDLVAKLADVAKQKGAKFSSTKEDGCTIFTPEDIVSESLLRSAFENGMMYAGTFNDGTNYFEKFKVANSIAILKSTNAGQVLTAQSKKIEQDLHDYDAWHNGKVVK